MGKSTLIGWLSVIHGVRERKNLVFPDVPALGRFLAKSNEGEWEMECYDEVEELGELSGLPYLKYASMVCASEDSEDSSCASLSTAIADTDSDFDPLQFSKKKKG